MLRRYLIPILVALALAVVVAVVAPDQLAVMAYKLNLIVTAGLAGLGLDIMAAPYAQPSGYLSRPWTWGDVAEGGPNYPIAPGCEWLFIAASVRRAVIVAVTMLAVGLGL